VFEGKQKLLPFPLKPIFVEAPFQQWGLEFIGEIHPPSLRPAKVDYYYYKLFHKMD
jgi:hypothetical protein